MTDQWSEESPHAGEPESDPSIAQAIQEISERAMLLVHEEIELAKAEISQKVSKLVKGAAIGAAASFFVIGALIMLLNGTAWFVNWVGGWPDDQVFWGFLITAGVLLLLAGLAGWIAAKAFKAGSPPIPEMAIHEAQKIKDTVASGDAGQRS
jgi:H+/Cl- antiporter ClcA